MDRTWTVHGLYMDHKWTANEPQMDHKQAVTLRVRQSVSVRAAEIAPRKAQDQPKSGALHACAGLRWLSVLEPVTLPHVTLALHAGPLAKLLCDPEPAVRPAALRCSAGWGPQPWRRIPGASRSACTTGTRLCGRRLRRRASEPSGRLGAGIPERFVFSFWEWRLFQASVSGVPFSWETDRDPGIEC